MITNKTGTTTENSTPTEDRSQVLRQLIQSSIETLVGFQQLNEQQFNQTLGALVRTKALSADDSYRLRDQLTTTEYFEKALDSRIEAILKRRGLIDDRIIDEVRATDAGADRLTT